MFSSLVRKKKNFKQLKDRGKKLFCFDHVNVLLTSALVLKSKTKMIANEIPLNPVK